MDLRLQTNNFTTTTEQPVRHTLFEVILLVIVAGLFYWFIVLPKQSSNHAQSQQYTALVATQSTLMDNKNKLEAAVADMQSHPEALAEMDEALPLDNRVSKLYIALEQLTQSSAMTVGDINVNYRSDENASGDKTMLANPYAAPRTLQKMVTTLTVTGTFDQFQGLLQKIESSGRLLNVTGIAINPGRENVFDFQVNLEAYYYE